MFVCLFVCLFGGRGRGGISRGAYNFFYHPAGSITGGKRLRPDSIPKPLPRGMGRCLVKHLTLERLVATYMTDALLPLPDLKKIIEETCCE